MQKRIALYFLLLISSLSAIKAQQGGRFIYEFTNIANSARVSALGSNFSPIDDDDIDLVYSNPALISDKMNNKISLNYLNYFPGTNMGFVSYGHKFNKYGTFVASLQYANYGTIDETDVAGNNIGTFSAGEYALIIGYSKKLSDKFKIGVNLKNILSSIASYNSYGLAADVSVLYSDRDNLLSSALVFKNIGRQITTYQSGIREPIPFQIQFGIAKKFEHAPFRLVFLFNDLQKWDLSYNDPNSTDNIDPFTGKKIEKNAFAKFGSNALEHIVLGTEFVPGKGNFALRLGYNFRRKQELKIAERSGMVGFSFGASINVSKIKFSYTRASYSLAGATNTISISANIEDFFKK